MMIIILSINSDKLTKNRQFLLLVLALVFGRILKFVAPGETQPVPAPKALPAPSKATRYTSRKAKRSAEQIRQQAKIITRARA